MAHHVQIDFSIAPWFFVMEFTPAYLKILFAVFEPFLAELVQTRPLKEMGERFAHQPIYDR
jgi:hypothetical protein